MKGFRFHPTEEELIDFLRHKILGYDALVHDAIDEINICCFDPWELPGQSKISSDDQVWYFLSSRVTKYPKGKAANRKTKNGYWKATGRDRKIKGRNQELIGSKKTLVFYKGRSPNAVRTSWVMHEYSCSSVPCDKEAYVLCKVKYKLNGEKSISPNSVTEHVHPPAACPEDHVGTEVTFTANNITEESPHEPVSDFSWFDGDLVLQWIGPDEVLTSWDLQFSTENNFTNDLLCSSLGSSLDDSSPSRFVSSLEDPKVSDKPETHFGNSLFNNGNESDCENSQTLLHTQMELEPVAELYVDGNFDSSLASSSESPGGKLQEISPTLVNVVQQHEASREKVNSITEESPPEPLSDFSCFDGDLGMQWIDLDEVLPSWDFQFSTENNSMIDLPCSQLGSSSDDHLWSQFVSSLEDPKVSDGPETQFGNSLFNNGNEFDSSLASSSESPGGKLQEISPTLVNVVQQHEASREKGLCQTSWP